MKSSKRVIVKHVTCSMWSIHIEFASTCYLHIDVRKISAVRVLSVRMIRTVVVVLVVVVNDAAHSRQGLSL